MLETLPSLSAERKIIYSFHHTWNIYKSLPGTGERSNSGWVATMYLPLSVKQQGGRPLKPKNYKSNKISFTKQMSSLCPNTVYYKSSFQKISKTLNISLIHRRIIHHSVGTICWVPGSELERFNKKKIFPKLTKIE